LIFIVLATSEALIPGLEVIRSTAWSARVLRLRLRLLLRRRLLLLRCRFGVLRTLRRLRVLRRIRRLRLRRARQGHDDDDARR